jgi:protein SCO1/2
MMMHLCLRAAFGAALVFSLVVTTRAEPPHTPKVVSRPFVGTAGNLSLTTLDEKAAFELSQSVIGQPVGDHVLLDREGRPIPLSHYRGKPLLVSFIYTACFHVCPTTTRNLQKAVEGTANTLGADRFNIISIGFNQPFDSPQAMKSFAQQYGIHLKNWEFLSPAAAIVGDLTRNFGFSYLATSAGFDHIAQVTIIDTQGNIARQVYGENFSEESLVEPLKAMVTGAPIPPGINLLTELGDRIRILCSVYDPIAGKYRTNYSLYLEIAGFLTFVIAIAWYLWIGLRSPKVRSD